jgi:hypothetical protein
MKPFVKKQWADILIPDLVLVNWMNEQKIVADYN